MFSKKHYPTIIKLRQKEEEFENIMSEYKEAYKTYQNYLKKETGEFWDIRESVDIDDSVGRLDVGFTENVTKEKCFRSCAQNKDCKYVLFNDSPRSCMLFDKTSSGFTNEGKGAGMGWEKPVWTDFKDTSYFDSGFTPGQSTPSWKYLGEATSLDMCKKKSVQSKKGPFSSVVYGESGQFKNNCYGGVVGGKINKQSVKGMHTSTPPGGSTSFSIQQNNSFNLNIGSAGSNNKVVTLPVPGLKVSDKPVNKQSPGWSDTFKTSVKGKELTVTRVDQDSGWGQNLVLKATAPNIEGIQDKIMIDKLLFLNEKLNLLLDEMSLSIDVISEKNKINRDESKLMRINMLQKGKQLANDRMKLLSLTNNMNTLTQKKESTHLKTNQDRYMLIGMTLLAFSLIGVTLREIMKQPVSNGQQ